MHTPTTFISDLKARLPKTRRMTDFYRRLDGLLPNWGSILSDPEFAEWLMRVDSESDSCMCDRLESLWQDPVCSTEDFATLLRLFMRWKSAQQRQQKPCGLKRFFQREAAPAEQPRYPVLSGKYEVLGLLGSGGNGDVYLVWSRETTSLYALKTIRAELAVNPTVRQSFRNEAYAWIGLGEHPNIAKAYFFEELETRLYITMAYVESDDNEVGPSLADRIASSPASVGDLCVWFCQVADGLRHAYGHGVRAHRDIKPGNVLIGRDGVARVSDFGLAVTEEVLCTSGSRNGKVEGTPLFMSPEQFVSPNECDQRSDIYSLGIALYQAASGSLPFMPRFAPKAPQDIHRYFSEVRDIHERARPKELPSPLWQVIQRCMCKRKEDRFADIDEFRAALVSVATQRGVVVPQCPQAGQNAWVLRDQGNTFMRLGKYLEAIKAYDEFLSVFPDGSVVFNRAVCLQNTGRYAEALKVYEPLALCNDVKGLVNGSNCLRKLGRKDEALSFARMAVQHDPHDVDCWVSLGNAASALARWEDAMRAYQTAHKLDPSAPTPAYNFGLAAERAGNTDSARLAYSTFLKLSLPDDSRREYVAQALNGDRGQSSGDRDQSSTLD